VPINDSSNKDVGIAVRTQYAGSNDFYISDNIMIGRDDRYRLLGWYNPGIYGGNRLKSYYAVKVYGSGHVVSHNYIAYFHDVSPFARTGRLMRKKITGRQPSISTTTTST
jgi:hypothetical protein